MLTGLRVGLAQIALMLNVFMASHGSDTFVHLTAYARQPGEYATWQICALPAGAVASFQQNPSRAAADAHGVVAQRNTLRIHVSARVHSGRYRISVLTYSYIDGISGGPLIRGFDPTLRVLSNHQAILPPFNTWFWIPAPDPEDYVHGPCTAVPELLGSYR